MKNRQFTNFDQLISASDISRMSKWFLDHVKTFEFESSKDQANIDLKKDHTLRVMGEMQVIAKSLGLKGNDLRIARIMALFHDLGRFDQYARYGTFLDAISEDHAALSLKVLEENQVLSVLSPQTRDLIIYCIKWHNKAGLPENAAGREAFFARLLRDADKLDIWRVVTRYYREKDRASNSVIELGLPNTPKISDKVHADIMAGKLVDAKHLKTMADFMALQMGWVFDLNYQKTFELLDKRGYLEKIARVLPDSRMAKDIHGRVRSCLEKRLAG